MWERAAAPADVRPGLPVARRAARMACAWSDVSESIKREISILLSEPDSFACPGYLLYP